MNVLVFSIAMLSTLFLCKVTRAENPLSSQDEQALDQTMDILNSPSAMKKEAAKNPEAAEILGKMRSLAGDDQTANEINKLAADIFSDLVRQSNGDSAKIIELLQKAAKDPHGFANSFKKERQDKLHELGKKIESRPKS